MTDTLLQAQGMSKRFGAVVANDEFSLTVERHQVHALIGPNGAGKTTAISLLSGEQKPDSGTVIFDGQDVTRLTAWKRARLGLHRSFQISSLFNAFSAIDNVYMALLARRSHAFQFLRKARRETALREQAREWLETVHLGQYAEQPVHTLAHGKRRQLELAVVLAAEPTMLLLDEPMAGMGKAESQQLVEIIAGLKGQHSILLVEHDMDVVFSLADVISVMVKGHNIATDTPRNTRQNPAVQAAYLGEYGDENP